MILAIVTAFAGGCTALLCLWGSVSEPLWWVLSFMGSFVVGLGLAFGFLYLMAARVDRSVPQEGESPFYRKLANLYVQALVGLCRVRIRKKGMEQQPEQGPFLLVCNHLCIADPAVLMHAFPKSRLAFISKKENDDMLIVGQIMHKLQCQLLDRENDRAALRTILKCIQILKEDRACVAVFPEGHCSEDGLLHRFRPGVFKIAQKAKVPIVVCTLRNTKAIIPGILKPLGSRVELHLTGVVRPEEFEGKTAVDLSEQVYQMMAADLGEELVCRAEMD